MKTIVKYILIALLCLSCAKQQDPHIPSAPDFSFTVKAVDTERTLAAEASGIPEVVVTIDGGGVTNYTMEYWFDDERTATSRTMTKLWPDVPRSIPVFGKKDFGRTRVSGKIYREDRLGATRTFETDVYVRGAEVLDISGWMKHVTGPNNTRTISYIDPDRPIVVYRWDDFDITFTPEPYDAILLTRVESDDPSILEVVSQTDTLHGDNNALVRAKALAEGTVKLSFTVLNGGLETTVVQTFDIVEDRSVLNCAVDLSSANIICNGATNSWKAYHPAEFIAEFSSANPEVEHDYSLSIDGVVVFRASNATILERKVSIPLDWEAVATTEGLVLSEGEHEFSFSVARCDGMDEDALTGKFVVEDTGLGIQKAEFKYQDTAGEWQMYNPGVVMVDFSLVNMESPHKVTLSIDGTDVYEEEHVRFSEGIAPGETATTYQFSLDWNTTSAKVDLTEGEHTFTLLVEREDGHSKASYSGTFEVTHTIPSVEVVSFSVSGEHWKGESLNVRSEVTSRSDAEGDMVFEYIIDGDASTAYTVEVPYSARSVEGTDTFTHTIPASLVPHSAGSHTVSLYVSFAGTGVSDGASAGYTTRSQTVTLSVSPGEVSGLAANVGNVVSLTFKVTCTGRPKDSYRLTVAGDGGRSVMSGETVTVTLDVPVTISAGTRTIHYTAVLYTLDGAVRLATASASVKYSAKEAI